MKNNGKNKNEMLTSIPMSQEIFACLFKEERYLIMTKKQYNTWKVPMSKCF